MAHAALCRPRFFPPQQEARPASFSLQQKTRPFPRPRSFSRIKPLLACSSDPHNDRSADEDSDLRVEISPSVFRSLQPQDASSSRISSGESLIERNLRKRANAQTTSSPSSSAEDGPAASASIDGNLTIYPERSGSSLLSSTGQDLQLTDILSNPLVGGSEDGSRYPASLSFPITVSFWQKTPLGCDIRHFHNLDYHAYIFRAALLLYAAFFPDSNCLQGLSMSSFMWLVAPMDDLSNPVLKNSEDVIFKWRRNAAEKCRGVVDDKNALAAASEFFSYLWSSDFCEERVASGKAAELILALAYSSYVYVLSGAASDSSYFMKKLTECSMHLRQSLIQLHGPPLDPIAVWERALKGSPFDLDGGVFSYDHSLIFPCKLKDLRNQSQFGPALNEIQNCLNKEFKGSDLIALLHRSSASKEDFFILVAPWYWVLTMETKHFSSVPAILCGLTCLSISQFSGAGLDIGFAWVQIAISLGWATILASLYFTNNMQLPTLLPYPNLGAVGYLSSGYGLVSSRSSLINTVLKNTGAPLAMSIVLVVCGWAFWGPLQYHSASVIDFGGYVLVPPDLFSHSGVLSKLLQSGSVEVIQADDATQKLAVSPVLLSGLLGLNFTAFTLAPGLRTNGGHLLRSVLNSKKLANQLNLAFFVLLTFVLGIKKPFLGLAWAVLSITTEPDCFVKDDVSDPDFVLRLAGTLLVAAAVTCFIPPFL